MLDDDYLISESDEFVSVTAIALNCPYCGIKSSTSPARVRKNQPGYVPCIVPAFWRDPDGSWWIGIMNCCIRPVLICNRGSQVYPHQLPDQVSAHIPSEINSDLAEAKLCLYVSAFRAASVMARRAMQTAVKDLGANDGTLAEQLKQLKDNGTITADLHQWATAVRFVGNDAAHPGGSPVTKEDAEAVVSLAEQFLHVVYVVPAMAATVLDERDRTQGQVQT
jgi:hypothetical protein